LDAIGVGLSRRRRNSAAAAACALVFTAWRSTCASQTLGEAVALAYQANPTLQAQRAQLRATDEEYVQAEAGFGPAVNLSGGVSSETARVALGAGLLGGTDQANYHGGTTTTTLSAVQPLYTFGALTAKLDAAGADILVNRQMLRQTESEVLQQTITAFLDVRRDRAELDIIRDEIAALEAEHSETGAKVKLGQLTRTDLAQADVRLLAARDQYGAAKGRLLISEAEYLRAVGQNAGALQPEPHLPNLPDTIDAAFDAAEKNNPQLLQAVAGERLARAKVNDAKAANGPNVSLRLDATVGPTEPYLQHSYEKSAALSVIYSQPIFASGLNQSKVREALEQQNRAVLTLEAERQRVVQSVAVAWSQLQSARSAAKLEQREVEAQAEVLKGDRVEERVGQRSTLELLNAEFESTNTKVALLQTVHDEHAAEAALLSAMGLLEARFIAPGTQVYSPSGALERVEHKAFDPLRPLVTMGERVVGPKTPPQDLGTSDAGLLRPIASHVSEPNP
jgi:outer membrane protein